MEFCWPSLTRWRKNLIITVSRLINAEMEIGSFHRLIPKSKSHVRALKFCSEHFFPNGMEIADLVNILTVV